MGIRTLPRRTAPGVAPPPVPVFAAAASTARIPVTLATALRHATVDLRRRLTDSRRLTDRGPAAVLPGGTPAWRLWTDLARGYLTLVLTLLPRPRPVRTITVFVATVDTVTAHPDGSAPYRSLRDRQGPEPDATP